jgi:hypothetical protein
MTDVPIDEPLPLGERVSDRLNPILVREIQQALSGKVFLMTMAGAVSAVVLLTVAVVLFGEGETRGPFAFAACLMCLAPIVLFIVPLQAFVSMRQEVSGGTAEQLLLSRLSPRRIVLGKLCAALVQFVLFLAIFAPVMAMTFLLRGVDVPTIALLLLFAALSCLAATVFAIALASVSRWRVLTQLLYAVTSAALFIVTLMSMVGAHEMVREIGWLLRSDEFWMAFLALLGIYLAGIVLCALTASAALAHAYENRSTQFRVYALVLLVVAFAWGVAVVPTSMVHDFAPWLAAIAAIALLPVWLGGICEDSPLSPRVRSHVPRRRVLALCAAPFLPGGGRGLLFTWLLGAMAMLGAVAIPPLWAGRSAGSPELAWAGMAWCYAAIYGLCARGTRARLGPGGGRSFVGFLATLFVLVLACLAPFVLEMLVTGRPANRWHIGHALNPFWTIERFPRSGSAPLYGVAVGAAVAVLLGLPTVVRSVREVTAASAARRRGAA